MKELIEKYNLNVSEIRPSDRQMRWYNCEKIAFFHFGVNTFSGNEWGEGNEDEKIFNPTSIDCRQWLKTIKAAGFKRAIITAKHHDGFCLWQSKYTSYSIINSPYKDGKGDVVREFIDACHEFNIEPGIYLSPWDRNYKNWGSEEYNEYYANQLTELLTQYGDIYEVWWDGAGSTEACYDFERWVSIVRRYQPNAVIFGSLGASPYVDIRWVGNEMGMAGDPCWCRVDIDALYTENTKKLISGSFDGNVFVPAESDVSIRPGWFFHEEQNQMVKTPAELMTIWFRTNGRNSTLLLNFPVDKRGLIHEIDAQNVIEFERRIKEMRSNNLAENAACTADSEWSDELGSKNMLSDDYNSFYVAQKGSNSAVINIDLKSEQEFNCIELREVIELGQKINNYEVLAKINGEWQLIMSKQCMGFRKCANFDTVKARYLKINITGCAGEPAVRYIGVYKFDEKYLINENAQSEPNDLTKNKSTKITYSDKEIIIDLGGIFPYNYVIFSGTGVRKYEIQSFNGSQYETICEGVNPDNPTGRGFPKVEGSYKLRIVAKEGIFLGKSVSVLNV